jgi:hypothetical protein
MDEKKLQSLGFEGVFGDFTTCDDAYIGEVEKLAGSICAQRAEGTVVGANGRSIPMKTAWIRNADGVVRLVTAVPGD